MHGINLSPELGWYARLGWAWNSGRSSSRALEYRRSGSNFARVASCLTVTITGRGYADGNVPGSPALRSHICRDGMNGPEHGFRSSLSPSTYRTAPISRPSRRSVVVSRLSASRNWSLSVLCVSRAGASPINPSTRVGSVASRITSEWVEIITWPPWWRAIFRTRS